MTHDGSPEGERSQDDSADDERATRLAALLSVQIGQPEQPVIDPRVTTVTEPELSEPPRRPDAPVPEPAVPGTATESGGRWRTGLSFWVLGVLVLAGLALVLAGWEIVRDSTEGKVVAEVDDPTAPGYEALVEATPTLVLFHDAGDELDAITVLTLPDPDGEGGGVLLVPRRTVTELPVFGEGPVEVAYDLGDDRVGAEAVGLLLGAAMAERTVVDDQRWA